MLRRACLVLVALAAWSYGKDESLMIVTPAADPDRRKGRRVDLVLGLNLLLPHGIFRGHRLAVEYGFPVYQ